MARAGTQMTRIPEGVRDILFAEAARLRAIEARVAAAFEAAGCRELVPPTLEFLDVLAGGSRIAPEELYKLVDRRGRVLALRPDFTTPIARMIATHYDAVAEPLRVWYAGQVFRCEDERDSRAHEFRQMGVEWIGAPGDAADAATDVEVLRLAAASLQAAGAREFAIAIGHVDALEGLWDGAGIDPCARDELRAALGRRDYVAYEQAVLRRGLAAEVAELLVNAVLAPPADARRLLPPFAAGAAWARARSGLEQLGSLVAALQEDGLGQRVSADLALVRDFRYYTGVVFQAFLPGAGAPVLGGGRYDNLLGEFGRPRPATGFALYLERLLAVLE